MKVFISWSGERGHALAESLHHYLHQMIQAIKPWLSSKDIGKGARWSEEIAKELDASSFGIVLLTPESQGAPWLNFEAGAITKNLSSGRAAVVLLGMRPGDVIGPLSQFQHTQAEKGDFSKLVGTLNAALEEPDRLSEGALRESFEMWWPKLEAAVSKIPAPGGPPAAPRELRSIAEETLEVVRSLASRAAARDLANEEQARKFLATLTPGEEKAGRMYLGIDPSKSSWVIKHR